MKKIFLIIFILLLIWFLYLYNSKEIPEKTLNITEFIVPEKIYLAINEEKQIQIKITEENNQEIKLKYINNSDILSIKNGFIKGLKEGSTKVTINAQNEKREIEVIVTNLITKPELNNDKPYLKCGEYNKSDVALLESILEYKINEAGYLTRGGALAAARFLLLEFKNGIKYFNENGRLENHSSILHIDGEGRYYHKGLYLNEDKYSEIVSSTPSGPKMWGCELKNNYLNRYTENGLNCSGFITWALYNAGYDIKDVGAGDFSYIHNELLDLRPRELISENLLNSNKIKAGDLIGFDGHIAMIIGIENNNYYIGESYETGLRVRTFNINELINSEFTDIILMDEYYKEEGNYKNMW